MTDLATDRLGLPLLAAGQAQKETTHNEALALLDLAVQASVVAAGLTDPPEAPAEGQCWIVGSGATGAWAGRPGAIAGWTAGGWRFVTPRAGLAAWNLATGAPLRCDGTGWSAETVRCAGVEVAGQQVVGARRPAIPAPSGGSTIDEQARAAIAAIIDALEAHGLIAGAG